MLDIKFIRNNPEIVKQAMKNRNIDNMDEKIEKLINIDFKRREIKSKAESIKSHQNIINKQIPKIKKSGEDISKIIKEMKQISENISELNLELNALEKKQIEILLSIPNIPDKSVPIGKDDSENIEIRRFGIPRKFDFDIKTHWDIGKYLNILDSERAAKVTGKRFHFYKDLGARLERSLINFFLNTHIKNGYTEILPPFMVNRESMTTTGQLPKFEEDAFKLLDQEYFMIPTAEVPVTNLYRNEILPSDSLPQNFCAYSSCFRAEVGSAGRDTRGIIRQHQFNKVELVKFVKPENSYNELEKLTNNAEQILKLLNLPYRVVCLSTGDLGFTAAKTYDIEVWMPSYGKYVEISSCSNFEDYQARRGSIRYKENAKDKTKLLHTLNGSGLAVGRTVAAILENYQNQDGSVNVPEVLVNMMGTNKINIYGNSKIFKT